MSISCTWHFLVPPGHITGTRLVGAVDLLTSRSLRPFEGPGPAIWAMNADGSGSAPFTSVGSAIQWIATEGGLVSFVDANEDELTLSVYLIGGAFGEALRFFGDTPTFDEIHLDISPRSAQSGGAAWRVFDEDAVALAARCGAVFASCLDELSLDAAVGQVDTHRAVSCGNLPTFPTNSVAVPDDGPLAEQLRSRSEQQPGTLLRRDGWHELRAESGLWPPELGGPATDEAKPST
jgi:hypothetical protein